MKFKNAGGGRLVETLTAGLYDGNSNCIREYVQNAVDSKTGLIEIDHINKDVDIRIRDYGEGMDEEELEEALKLGFSSKNDKMVGWRGIGIYSGVPNFRTIYINTKKRGSLRKLHITIHCDLLRQAYIKNLPIEEILEAGVPDEIESIEDSNFKEGTEVILSNIERGQQNFFERERLKENLIMTLPLRLHDSEVRDKIVKFLKSEGIEEPNFVVKLNKEELFRPPLDTSLFDMDSFTNGVVSAKDGTKLLAYWSLTSKKNSELRKSKKNFIESPWGLLIKKKQFTLGDNNTFRRMITSSYNYWNYGELHILDNEIKENASRNFLELNSGHSIEFIDEVAKLIPEIQRNNRKKSSKDKWNELIVIEKKIKDGSIKEADKDIKNVMAKLGRNVSGATTTGLKDYSDLLEKRAKEQIAMAKELKAQVDKLKIDETEQDFLKVFQELPSSVKRIVQSKIRDPSSQVNFDHILNPIQQKIKVKSKSSKSDFSDLIKEVFRINSGEDLKDIRDHCKLFLFDPGKLASNDNRPVTVRYSYYVTTEFAHILHGLYQIFVNGEKHHSKEIGEALFKNSSKKEIAEFFKDLQSTISLCERMVDLTIERNQVKSFP